jgi:hypothetical protein
MASMVHKLSNVYKLEVPGWFFKEKCILPQPANAYDSKNKENQKLYLSIHGRSIKAKLVP